MAGESQIHTERMDACGIVSKADPGGDYSGVHELFELIKDPYGEGSADDHEKYYRRAPDKSLRAGGTAFMS